MNGYRLSKIHDTSHGRIRYQWLVTIDISSESPIDRFTTTLRANERLFEWAHKNAKFNYKINQNLLYIDSEKEFMHFKDTFKGKGYSGKSLDKPKYKNKTNKNSKKRKKPKKNKKDVDVVIKKRKKINKGEKNE